MTPDEAIRFQAARFRRAGVPDPVTDASLLLSSLMHVPALTLRLDRDTHISPETLAAFESLCERRLKREPLQYILGDTPFMGHVFRTDARALIPRPETELLCERAIDLCRAHAGWRVLDLCCGTGCIGLSIALDGNAQVTLSDLSPDALALARENADRLGARAAFVQGDLFSPFQDDQFDLIISNPPYIPSSECLSLQAEVLSEPRIALDGGGDGLTFYRRIAGEAPAHLPAGGTLLLEIGNTQGAAVLSLLREHGFEARLSHDYAGLERIVEGVLTGRQHAR